VIVLGVAGVLLVRELFAGEKGGVIPPAPSA